jgi:hypothetical protein
MIHEYQVKKESVPEQIKAFEQAGTDLKMAACVGDTFGQEQIDVGRVHERTIYASLTKSAWLRLHKELRMDVLMTAKDQSDFDRDLSNLPEFNMDNIRATFGDYIIDPQQNILRGLAEVFCDLDPYYKSHEKMKIGVDGLPKRIIISGFGGFYTWGWEKLQDVVNALASYRGEKLTTNWELDRQYKELGEDFLKDRGMSFKKFKNGNGHLFFEPNTLKDINTALSEYYGDVLADCHEEKPTQKQQSTEVSKDLQYYPTPENVVDKVLSDFYIKDGEKVLEPSCGCGRFMDGIKKKFPNCTVNGIEFDFERASTARSKGHAVHIGNFLEVPANPIYDRVIMNPPFYGKHYAKHIEHALKFLKEDGVLTSILPATARYDHGLIDGCWDDLPLGSFRESGTNINTTVLTIRK